MANVGKITTVEATKVYKSRRGQSDRRGDKKIY